MILSFCTMQETVFATEIGQEAFAYCESLTAVSIPDSVSFFDAGIFTGNFNLTYAYIGG